MVPDAAPPDVTCPPNVTVECVQAGGSPATHQAIAEFLAGADAVDNCDHAPSISNDANDFFDLGLTVVTFTATDANGNAASCTAVVTVVDTADPELTAELRPSVLSPPDHTLVSIAATVSATDVCDPQAKFALSSISSDEPENGLGDGDTPQDIQGDALGTPDTAFRLRAERSGTGDRRTYTVVYAANDSSGNSSQAAACVNVPHDRGRESESQCESSTTTLPSASGTPAPS